MIFVTVGTQLPFDRLVVAIDDWAVREDRTDVFAQVGRSSYRPVQLDAAPNLSAERFEETVCGAELIVAHAGMGSILTALEYSKPLILMPRMSALGEHRNDHQLATAAKFRKLQQIWVAEDERALPSLLNEVLRNNAAGKSLLPEPSQVLLETIRDFVGVGRS